MLQFTKEIKNKWLNACKSGKYVQGFDIFNSNGQHCCLAVLADILNLSTGYKCETVFKLLGTNTSEKLITANDREYPKNPENTNLKRDYSNVIPLIEELPTVD